MSERERDQEVSSLLDPVVAPLWPCRRRPTLRSLYRRPFFASRARRPQAAPGFGKNPLTFAGRQRADASPRFVLGPHIDQRFPRHRLVGLDRRAIEPAQAMDPCNRHRGNRVVPVVSQQPVRRTRRYRIRTTGATRASGGGERLGGLHASNCVTVRSTWCSSSLGDSHFVAFWPCLCTISLQVRVSPKYAATLCVARDSLLHPGDSAARPQAARLRSRQCLVCQPELARRTAKHPHGEAVGVRRGVASWMQEIACTVPVPRVYLSDGPLCGLGEGGSCARQSRKDL